MAIGVLAIVSMTLGLLISASVDTSEKTMPLLIVAVIFQVVMTGGVFPLAGKAGLEQVAWLAPSRWGFAAAASTVNLNVISLPVMPKVPAVKKPAPGIARAARQASQHKASRTLPSPRTAPGRTADGSAQAGEGAHAGRRSHGSAKAHASPSAHRASPGTTTQTATADSSSTVDPLWKHVRAPG